MSTLTSVRAGDCDCDLCSQGVSALHLAVHYGWDSGDHSLDVNDNESAKSVQILLKYHANVHAANHKVSLQPYTMTWWMFPVPCMLSALLSRAAMYAVTHVSRRRASQVATGCHPPKLKATLLSNCLILFVFYVHAAITWSTMLVHT